MILVSDNFQVHNMFPNEHRQERFFQSPTSYSRKYFEKKRLAEAAASSRNSDNLIIIKRTYADLEKRDIVLVREKDLDKVHRPYLEYESIMHQSHKHHPSPPDYQPRFPSPRMPFYQPLHRPFVPPHADRAGPSWQRHYRSQVPRKRHHLDDIFLPNFDEDEDNPLAEERFPHRSPTYRPPVRRELTGCKDISPIRKENTTSQVETQAGKSSESTAKPKNETKSNSSSTVADASKANLNNVKNKKETNNRKDSCATSNKEKHEGQSNKKSLSDTEKSKKEINTLKEDKGEKTNRGATSRTHEQSTKSTSTSKTSIHCCNSKTKDKEQSAPKSRAVNQVSVKESARRNSDADDKNQQKSKNPIKTQTVQKPCRKKSDKESRVRPDTDSDTDIVKELEALINKPIVRAVSCSLEQPVKQTAPDLDEKSRQGEVALARCLPSKNCVEIDTDLKINTVGNTVEVHQQESEEKSDGLSRIKSDELVETKGAPTSGIDNTIKKTKTNSEEQIVLKSIKVKGDSDKPPEIIVVPSSPSDRSDGVVQKTAEDCSEPKTPKNSRNNENRGSSKDIDEERNSKMSDQQYLDDFGVLETRKSFLGTFHKIFDDSRVVDMDISNSPITNKETLMSEQQIITNRVIKDMETFWQEISHNKGTPESSNSILDKRDVDENKRFGEHLIRESDTDRSRNTTSTKCDENQKTASDTSLGLTSKDAGSLHCESNLRRSRASSLSHEDHVPSLRKKCRKTKSLSDIGSNNSSSKHGEVDATNVEKILQPLQFNDKSCSNPLNIPSTETQTSNDRSNTDQIISKTSSTSPLQENYSEINDSKVPDQIINNPSSTPPSQENDPKVSTQIISKTSSTSPLQENSSEINDSKVPDQIISNLSTSPSQENDSRVSKQIISKTSSTSSTQENNSEINDSKVPDQKIDDQSSTSLAQENDSKVSKEIISKTSSTLPSQENNSEINDSKMSADVKKSVGSQKIQKNEDTHQKRKREIEMKSCDENSVKKKPNSEATRKSEKNEPKQELKKTEKSIGKRKQSSDDIRMVKKTKNVTESAVTSDASTSQIPAAQTPTKYITKAEYVKSFARNKSPVPNIRLSIEAIPKAKSIARRRATFTCEADNETILKKVDSGVSCRQKFLDLFGSISEDEEDLIQLPTGRSDIDEKQNMYKKNNLERRESPDVQQVKKVKLDKEEKASFKTDSVKSNSSGVPPSKTVFKKNREAHSNAATANKNRSQKKDIDQVSRTKDKNYDSSTYSKESNKQPKSRDVDKHLSEVEESGNSTTFNKDCRNSLIVKISPIRIDQSNSKNMTPHRRDSSSSTDSFKSNSLKSKKSDLGKDELIAKDDTSKKIKSVSEEIKARQSSHDKKVVTGALQNKKQSAQKQKPKPSFKASKISKSDSNTGTNKKSLKETTTPDPDKDNNKKSAKELQQKESQVSNTDNASEDLNDQFDRNTGNNKKHLKGTSTPDPDKDNNKKIAEELQRKESQVSNTDNARKDLDDSNINTNPKCSEETTIPDPDEVINKKNDKEITQKDSQESNTDNASEDLNDKFDSNTGNSKKCLKATATPDPDKDNMKKNPKELQQKESQVSNTDYARKDLDDCNTGTNKKCLKGPTTSNPDADHNEKNAKELEQKDSLESNSDNASKDLNDTSTLGSFENSLNGNIEIYSYEQESRNSANNPSEHSTQDYFSGSSEISLIIDEVENFPLLCRASESEFDEEEFHNCVLFKSIAPKLDKLTKISLVKDADFDTVYVHEPIELHSDTKIVQQNCKEDDVIEIRPVIPLIDLTEENATKCIESIPKNTPGELTIETKKEIMELTATPVDHATVTLYRSEENVSRQEDVQAMTATIPSQLILRTSSKVDVKKDIESDQQCVSDNVRNISDKASPESPNLVASHEVNAMPPKETLLQTLLSKNDNVGAPDNSVRLASESLENENNLAVSSIINIAQDVQPRHSNPNTSEKPDSNNMILSALLSMDTSSAIESVSPTVQNNAQSSTSDSGQQIPNRSSIQKENNITGTVAVACSDNASENVVIEISQPQSSGQHTGLPQTLREYRSVRRHMPVSTCRPPNLVNIASSPRLSHVQQQNSITTTSTHSQLDAREPIIINQNNIPNNPISIALRTQNKDPRSNQPCNVESSSASVPSPVRSEARNPTIIIQTTDVSTRSVPVPPVNENPRTIFAETCINLTEDSDEVSILDQRLVIEVLTRHIYFLAHLCKAQNAYIDNLRKHQFCKSYFEAEIDLFEKQKRARLESQSLRLARDLQQLNIDATRNLSATALLIMDQVSTNLLNRDMPQQATKSMMYLLMYQLVKPSSSSFESSPFLKTLLKHCEVVVNRLYSRSGVTLTPVQRQILTQQINEFNKMLLRQKQANEGQFNAVTPRLNKSPNLAPRPIYPPPYNQPLANSRETNNSMRQTSFNPQRNCYDDRSAARSLQTRPTANQPLMTTGQSTTPPNNSPTMLSRPLGPSPTYRPRPASVSTATTTSNPINRSNFAVPGAPKPRLAHPNQSRASARSRLSKAKTSTVVSQQNLPGGPNTVNLGCTPRYVPNYDTATVGSVYAPMWKPNQQQNSNILPQRPTRQEVNHPNTNYASPSSNHPVLAETLDSTVQEASKRSSIVQNLRYKIPADLQISPISDRSQPNTVSSTPKQGERHQTPGRNPFSPNTFSDQHLSGGSFTDFSKKRNEDLLQELLSTSSSVPVFASGSTSTNDNFRITLPFTQPESVRSTVISTTSNASTSIQPSSSVHTRPLSSLVDRRDTAPTSASSNVLVNNTETTTTNAHQPKEPVVLNQGFAALSSIGPASVMLNRSSFPRSSKSNQQTVDQSVEASKSIKQSKKPSTSKATASAPPPSKAKCKTKIKPPKKVTKTRRKKAAIEIVDLLSSDEEEQHRDKSITENTVVEEQPVAVDEAQNNIPTDLEQSGRPQSPLAEPQLITVDAEIQNPQYSVFDSPNINSKVGSKETVDPSPKVILNHIEGTVEEDIETIDLTWIDYVDDTELQQEIDFVFVKKETEEQGDQSEPNNIVQSPADSGISSPPIQTEDDTTDSTVYVEKLCVCASTALYNCICGLAVYCGRECQLKDWYSHQKVCSTAQNGTEAKDDAGSVTEEVNPPDNT